MIVSNIKLESLLTSGIKEDAETLVHYLPREMILKIFSYLGARSLCTVSQVCKHWKLLSDQKELWINKYKKRFKLNPVMKVNEEDYKKKFLDRCIYESKSLLALEVSLNNYTLQNREVIPDKIVLCEFLKRFDYPNGIDLSARFAQLINDDNLEAMCQSTPRLRILSLREFNKKGFNKVSEKCIQRILAPISKLKVLNLSGCENLTEEGVLSCLHAKLKIHTLGLNVKLINNNLLNHVCENIPSIKKIIISGDGSINFNSFIDVLDKSMKLKCVEFCSELIFNETGNKNKSNLKQLNIVELIIRSNEIKSETALVNVVSRFPSLKKCVLKIHNIDEKCVSIILGSCPEISFIILTGKLTFKSKGIDLFSSQNKKISKFINKWHDKMPLNNLRFFSVNNEIVYTKNS